MDNYNVPVDFLYDVLGSKGMDKACSGLIFYRLVSGETPIEKCVLTGLKLGRKHKDFMVGSFQIWTRDKIFVISLKFMNAKTNKYDHKVLEFQRPDMMDYQAW